MPIYEYECEKCHHQLEALQKISDKPLRECPECGRHSLKRLVSAPLFRLAGSGWYETDFKSDKEARRNLAGKDEAPAAEPSSSSTKDEKPASTDTKASTESKPAAPASSTTTEPRKTMVTGSARKPSAPAKPKSPARKPAAKKKAARRR